MPQTRHSRILSYDLRSMVMRSVLINVIAAYALLTAVFTLGEAWGDAPPAPDANSSPMDLVNRTPKGNLHNPYKDSEANIVSQGETLFRTYPCSGCHGGGAGGGMAPPLTKG